MRICLAWEGGEYSFCDTGGVSGSAFVRSRWRIIRRFGCTGAFLVFLYMVKAQEPAPKLNIPVPGALNPDGDLATLHVYTNLEQVPVLVLSETHDLIKHRFKSSRFRVSLDSGPLFPPTYVRQEGDDPISLAVLIDATKHESLLLPKARGAVTKLALGSLKPTDRISIYAMACALVRTVYDIPPDAARLQQAVEDALKPWQESAREPHKKSCRATVPLWDSLAFVTKDLTRLPGRRVVVALTDGIDTGSRTNWNSLRQYAQWESVAVFGILPPNAYRQVETVFHGPIRVARDGLPGAPASGEDRFDMMCQLTGGVEIEANEYTLPKKLLSVLDMVRDRYIVEYPRSDALSGGNHSLFVSILESNAYVRPTGIMVPIADRKLLGDPLTIPAEPGKAPAPGERRILVPSPN